MIKRFRQITPNLYRGGAPAPKDVLWLKENLGIKKIVSLDQITGEKIDRTCKMLGIEHIKMYIGHNRKELIRFLTQDFHKLFLEDGPVFFHCFEGKDRTGLAAALIKCKYFGMEPSKAIAEAKSLGFGIGIPPQMTKLFEKIILSCKPSKIQDQNNASIVSNEREYKGDNRDGVLDEAHQGSFAPYLDSTRQYPMDAVYNYINDQSPTRENRLDNETLKKEHNFDEENVVPQVGVFNNDAGIHGSGPTEPVGGFIYD